MKAEIPVHYDVHSGSRGSHRYREQVSLEIREPTMIDAPNSVEWEYGATRWFEGSHYRAIATIFERGMNLDEREAALSSYLTKDGETSYSETRAYVDTKRMSADRKFNERRHPDAARHFKRFRAIEKAEALAADCLVVDGKIWFRCGEPRLVYRPATRHTAASLSVETTDWNEAKDRYRFGRCVEYPSLEVAAYSARLDTPENLQPIMDRWALVPAYPAFKLHMPESIFRDEYLGMIKDASYGLVFAWKFGDLSHKASDEMRAIAYDLSMYLDETDEEDVDYDQLATFLALAMAALPGVERKKKDLLSTVLRRWEDRPIGNDLAMSPSHIAPVR